MKSEKIVFCIDGTDLLLFDMAGEKQGHSRLDYIHRAISNLIAIYSRFPNGRYREYAVCFMGQELEWICDFTLSIDLISSCIESLSAKAFGSIELDENKNFNMKKLYEKIEEKCKYFSFVGNNNNDNFDRPTIMATTATAAAATYTNNSSLRIILIYSRMQKVNIKGVEETNFAKSRNCCIDAIFIHPQLTQTNRDKLNDIFSNLTQLDQTQNLTALFFHFPVSSHSWNFLNSFAEFAIHPSRRKTANNNITASDNNNHSNNHSNNNNIVK